MKTFAATFYPEGQRDGVWAHPYQLAQPDSNTGGAYALWVTVGPSGGGFAVQQPEDSQTATWFETIGHSLPSSSPYGAVRSGDNGEVCFIPAMASLPTVCAVSL